MTKIIVMNDSPSFSFQNWDIISFLKGRKKLIISAVGGLLGWFIFDSATVAILSAGVVEIGFALAEYFIKKR